MGFSLPNIVSCWLTQQNSNPHADLWVPHSSGLNPSLVNDLPSAVLLGKPELDVSVSSPLF